MSVAHAPGYGTYIRIWLVLLALTVVMLFLDTAPVPRGLLIGVLVVAMLAKAGLISGWFMHLRFERLVLGLAVALGLLLNGAILFVLIAPDSLRIFRMVSP
jgi:caa(3)-type oxidase subunit IV